jgi:probable phosphoglycerate mutase
MAGVPMAMFIASAGMSGVRRFLIVRHGETTWNADERLQGTIDESSLTLQGEEQAAALGRRLLAEEAGQIDAVWVSSLGRARQTYAIVRAEFAKGDEARALPDARVTPELREIDLGKWQGQIKGELATGAEAAEWRAWKEDPTIFAFADGVRPLHELVKRAERCWRELLLADDSRTPTAAPRADSHVPTTLVVAHGGLNRALMVTALGLPIGSFTDPRFQFGNCYWAEVELGPAGSGPDGAGHSARWRWRHPGPAGEWQTAERERADALLRASLEGPRAEEEIGAASCF